MSGGNGKSRSADRAAEELARGLSLPMAQDSLPPDAGVEEAAMAGECGEETREGATPVEEATASEATVDGVSAQEACAGSTPADEDLAEEALEVGTWEENLQAGALDSGSQPLPEAPEQPTPEQATSAEAEPPPPAQRSAILEALLFASAVPVRTADLQEACGWPLAILNRDLDRLTRDLAGRGLELQRVAGAWLLVTAAETAPWVERFLKVQSRKQLSRAQLETLAVVAYRQPVTRAEVDAYRGVRSERTLHQLEDLRLVREVGRAELPGRPIQYGTTTDFLRYFSLDRLEDLPAVERGGAHLRRLRGPFRPTPQEAAAAPQPPGEPAAPPEEPADAPEGPALPPEAEAAPSEDPAGPSQGLRRLLDRIRRRTRRESREDPGGAAD